MVSKLAMDTLQEMSSNLAAIPDTVCPGQFPVRAIPTVPGAVNLQNVLVRYL